MRAGSLPPFVRPARRSDDFDAHARENARPCRRARARPVRGSHCRPRRRRAGARPTPACCASPTSRPTQIVFVYADDLWRRPARGGRRPPAGEPAGRGDPAPLQPGRPDARLRRQLRRQPTRSTRCRSTAACRRASRTTRPSRRSATGPPDGRLIFSARGMGTYPRVAELCTVAARGRPARAGCRSPTAPTPSISADGRWLAYTPHAIDHRTWKRYRGGMATDVWLFDLVSHEAKRATDWEGIDTLPMWNGAELVLPLRRGPDPPPEPLALRPGDRPARADHAPTPTSTSSGRRSAPAPAAGARSSSSSAPT